MESKRRNVFLYFIATTVNLLSFSTGISIVWIAPILPKLLGNQTTEDNPFGRSLTSTEISWIVGFLPFGAILGPIFVGATAEKIGRKYALLILGCINSVALLITVFAKTIGLFYIARFLAGVALAGAFTVIPMFLAEISENHNRGTLGCTMSIFLAAGSNFAFIIGPYLSIQNYSIVCLVPLVIFIPVFAILSPETPTFLASVNKQKALAISLTKLRNKKPEDLQLEIRSYLQCVQENSLVRRGIRELFKLRCLRKGLMISLGVIVLPQIAGIGAILSYMPTIFETAKVDLAPEICVIIVGAFQVLGTVLSSTAVDRFGRKILLFGSSICACVSLVVLGLYFELESTAVQTDWISWLPILSLVIFIVTFNVGLGPVPWVIMTELFPVSYTSTAAALTSTTCFATSFIVTVTFPTLLAWVGMAKCFFIFSALCLSGSVFVYFILPETKGRSIPEIQKLLGG